MSNVIEIYQTISRAKRVAILIAPQARRGDELDVVQDQRGLIDATAGGHTKPC